jgi:hypothetical protein
LTDEFLSTWGSSVFRISAGGPPWEMQSPIVPPEGPGRLPLTRIYDSMPVGAEAYSVSPYLVVARHDKPLVRIEAPRYARLLSKLTEYTDLYGAWFCTESSCECPPGTTGELPPTKPLSNYSYLAISGDPHGFNEGEITYHSLDELCHQKSPPKGPHPPRVKPGFWKATGHITGGFQTTNGETVRLVSGGGFSFCMHVLNAGGVDSQTSSWRIQPSRIDLNSESGVSGHADVSGSGDFTGYLGAAAGARNVEFTGQMHFDFTIDIGGFTYTQHTDSPVDGPLDISKVSATRFSGDFVIANEQAQQNSGLASNEKGTYVARPVGSC